VAYITLLRDHGHKREAQNIRTTGQALDGSEGMQVWNVELQDFGSWRWKSNRRPKLGRFSGASAFEHRNFCFSSLRKNSAALI
jgi:hypothetical protein